MRDRPVIFSVFSNLKHGEQECPFVKRAEKFGPFLEKLFRDRLVQSKKLMATTLRRSSEFSTLQDDIGKVFPDTGRTYRPFLKSDGNDFKAVIAETLRETYGRSGRSIKTVMAYTGAGERAVKNWFGGKNGPNGENLVELVRHSDEVLEALLLMAGRKDILAGKLLVDAREKLVEMIEIIDQLHAGDSVADPTND